MMPLHTWSVRPTRALLLLLAAAAVIQGVEQSVQNDVGKCRLYSRYGPFSSHLLLQLLRFLYATDLFVTFRFMFSLSG
jgi:hypothetical protein